MLTDHNLSAMRDDCDPSGGCLSNVLQRPGVDGRTNVA